MLIFEFVVFVLINLILLHLSFILMLVLYPAIETRIIQLTSVRERFIFSFHVPLFILVPLYYLVNPKYGKTNLSHNHNASRYEPEQGISIEQSAQIRNGENTSNNTDSRLEIAIQHTPIKTAIPIFADSEIRRFHLISVASRSP